MRNYRSAKKNASRGYSRSHNRTKFPRRLVLFPGFLREPQWCCLKTTWWPWSVICPSPGSWL